MIDATNFVFGIAILLFSVVIHEVSHGVAAYLQGDKTAQYAGRLTLNPIPHIDPFGSIILPLMLHIFQSPFLIGWAKPVPYNPYNLRNQKWGPALVGAAGPGSNFAIAAFFGFLAAIMPIAESLKEALFIQFAGSGFRAFHIGTTPFETFFLVSLYITLINLALGVFNLMPIPPLDGSKVLFALLPYTWHRVQATLEAYGFMLVVFFIVFLSPVISIIVGFLFRLFTGLGI